MTDWSRAPEILTEAVAHKKAIDEITTREMRRIEEISADHEKALGRCLDTSEMARVTGQHKDLLLECKLTTEAELKEHMDKLHELQAEMLAIKDEINRPVASKIFGFWRRLWRLKINYGKG